MTQKENLVVGIDDNEKSSYVSYASYYILFFLGAFAEMKSIDLTYNNKDEIWAFKNKVLKFIESLIKKERETLSDKYSHVTFFKYNRPKRIYEEKKRNEVMSFIEAV